MNYKMKKLIKLFHVKHHAVKSKIVCKYTLRFISRACSQI